MNIPLPDVNVLLALCDPHHIHHEAAHRWFEPVRGKAWATCPLTENAFVRIASQPAYPNSPGGPAITRAMLQELCRSPGHRFWEDSVSLRNAGLFQQENVITPNQITDIYLLGLAASRQGVLVTFDQRIPATAVKNGAAHLLVLRPHAT